MAEYTKAFGTRIDNMDEEYVGSLDRNLRTVSGIKAH